MIKILEGSKSEVSGDRTWCHMSDVLTNVWKVISNRSMIRDLV